jgi:hypothetical protein
MKKQFHQFYVPTAADLEHLWSSCLFCFDTNVLLNLYHYSEPTTKAFLDILTSLGNRIWMLHHVALEYHHLRCGIILKELAPYKDIAVSLRRIEETLAKSPTEHPFVKTQTVTRFKRMSKSLLKELEEGQEIHQRLLKNDPILDKLTVLFDNRTGEPYSAERLQQIEKDGDTRNNGGIPPGHCDKGKDLNKFGDLIIWMQMLDKAKADKRGIIFVTNDEKKDWWHKRLGGPCPELRAEMKAVADAACYFYTGTEFVEQAKGYLKSNVKNEVIREMKEAAAERNLRDATVQVSYGDLGISVDELSRHQLTADTGYFEVSGPALQKYVQPVKVPRSDWLIRLGEFSQIAGLIEDWCQKAKSAPFPLRLLSLLAVIERRLELFNDRWGSSLSWELSQPLGRLRVLCDTIGSTPWDDSRPAHLQDAAVILHREFAVREH